jgi:hypothetical protein
MSNKGKKINYPKKRLKRNGLKSLRNKEKRKISYKTSSLVKVIEDKRIKTLKLTASFFSASLPSLRAVSIPAIVAYTSIDQFCKVRGILVADFTLLLKCYVYTIAANEKFFGYKEIAKFTASGTGAVTPAMVRLSALGQLQPVSTGQLGVQWKTWKGPLKPKHYYMIAVKGYNLIVEWWDYQQQILSNFTLDYLENLPE